MVVYNEQGIPVCTSNNEIEAQTMAAMENGWYKEKEVEKK